VPGFVVPFDLADAMVDVVDGGRRKVKGEKIKSNDATVTSHGLCDNFLSPSEDN
jgi:hypothetical protein